MIAPYADDGRYAREFEQQGWNCLAVTLAHRALPPAYERETVSDAYRKQVAHVVGFLTTIRRLRRARVTAVVAGGPLGADLTDQLARHLGLPGNDPSTSVLRHDRSEQAGALAAYHLSALRGLRTTSLPAALQWASFQSLPGYTIAAADTSVIAPSHVCRTMDQIKQAWRQQHHAAVNHGVGPHLVIQEHISGPQFLVQSISGPGAAGTSEHAITEVWSDSSVTSHLLPLGTPLRRVLSLYTQRVLDALRVQTGPVSCRIVYTPERGPVLLAARAYPCPRVPRDQTLIRDSVRALSTPGSALSPGGGFPSVPGRDLRPVPRSGRAAE
ncbi:hypothetical protein [Streptomyces sp. NPDC055039]